MTASRLSFLVFMLLCIAGFCALGIWQVKRLHWKEGLIAQLDAAYAQDVLSDAHSGWYASSRKIASLEKDHFLRDAFAGRFYFSRAFNLMGQIDNGKQTSHIMVPLEVSKDVTVLVDMGPDFKLPGDQWADITGLLKNAPRPNAFTPDNVPDQHIWFSINTEQLKIPNLKPLVILPEYTRWKEYPVKKPELRNDHLQYAIFWFTMAVITAGLTLYSLARRKI